MPALPLPLGVKQPDEKLQRLLPALTFGLNDAAFVLGPDSLGNQELVYGILETSTFLPGDRIKTEEQELGSSKG